MANLIQKSIAKNTQIIAQLLNLDGYGVRHILIEKQLIDGAESSVVRMMGKTQDKEHTNITINLNPNVEAWCVNNPELEREFSIKKEYVRTNITDGVQREQLNQAMIDLGMAVQLIDNLAEVRALKYSLGELPATISINEKETNLLIKNNVNDKYSVFTINIDKESERINVQRYDALRGCNAAISVSALSNLTGTDIDMVINDILNATKILSCQSVAA